MKARFARNQRFQFVLALEMRFIPDEKEYANGERQRHEDDKPVANR